MKFIINSLFVIVFCFLAQDIFSQEVLRAVTPKDYSLWSDMGQEKVSDDGLWYSYTLDYSQGVDSTFIKHVHGGKAYQFSKVSSASFSSDNRYCFVKHKDNVIEVITLETGQRHSFKNVVRFEYLPESHFFVVHLNDQKLEILNEKKELEFSIADVTEFAILPNSDLVYITSLGLSRIDFGKIITTRELVSVMNGKLKGISLDSAGTSIAFYQEFDIDNQLFYTLNLYHSISNKHYSIDLRDQTEFVDYHIINRINLPLLVSDYGEKVFFHQSQRVLSQVNLGPEIWDSHSPYEYPVQQLQDAISQRPKLAVWIVNENSIVPIGSDVLPNCYLSPDKRFAIAFHGIEYEPQFERDGFADIFLIDTSTGKREKIISRLSKNVTQMGFSPAGRYFYYFYERDWWVYDLKNFYKKNLTKCLGVTFENHYNNYPGTADAYNNVIWMSDESALFVHDKNDIWQLFCNGMKAKRISHGKKTNTVYRLAEELTSKTSKIYLSFVGRTLDKSSLLVAHVRNENFNTGYYYLMSSGKWKAIVSGQCKIDRIKKMGNGWIVNRQSYSFPSQLTYIDSKSQLEKVLFQSNSHYTQFTKPDARLISYKNEIGETMTGILYVPADFDPKKRYPMVVYIYEKLSGKLHDYPRPTLFDGTGFALANYIYDGYLVLLPDITYEIGNPGPSARDCVLSSVKAVERLGFVNMERIGLIGHSFGGYEVSYIITQTNVFAAAVAGAPATNLISHYFTAFSSQSNGWKFESQQYRIGYPPMSDFKNYLYNSPIFHSSKITTPLLSWTGKEDKNVPWRLSHELHLALRRLGKINILLVYPNEGHILIRPENQKDLGLRIKNWFDLHLKS
jgi:acetyl esterase/lipase